MKQKTLFIAFEGLSFGEKNKNLMIADTSFNLKIYDLTTWLTNNCNTQLGQYLRSKGNQMMKFGQLLEYNMRTIFLEKSFSKYGMPSEGLSSYIKTKLRTTCFYLL